jgi:hypothetical protein
MFSALISIMAMASACKKDSNSSDPSDIGSTNRSKNNIPTTSGGTPTSFIVQAQYLQSDGVITVSETTVTNIKIDLQISRYTQSSTMYQSGNFKYSVIYVDYNGNEIMPLTQEVTVTGSDYNAGITLSNGMGTLNRVLDVAIPANQVGGYVTLKYKSYDDFNGDWKPNYSTTNRYRTGLANTAPPTQPSLKAPPGGPAGNYPVYAYYVHSGAQRLFAIAPNVEPSPTNFQGAKFRVFPTQQPGTVPVHEWEWYLSKNTSNKDFYYSTNAYAIHVPDYGWKHFRPDRFYAYPSQVAGTVPVYRYYGYSKYKMTADPAEIASLNSNGNYRNEGIAFYAFPI